MHRTTKGVTLVMVTIVLMEGFDFMRATDSIDSVVGTLHFIVGLACLLGAIVSGAWALSLLLDRRLK